MPRTNTLAEAAAAAAPAAPVATGRGPGAGEAGWMQRRDQLRAGLEREPLATISPEEVEAHFAGMTARYWERVTDSDLVWGLECIHRFLDRVATPHTPATMPVMDWRHLPGGAGTRVMLCTWDRPGLLAKAAACFSATHLSIQQADVFTRADHIVLDVFRVCPSDGPGVAAPDRLEQMGFLLDGAMSEPARFASVWACSRHKFLAPPPLLPPRITFDNGASSAATLLRLEASDRLGLLYDVLQALAGAGLNVTQAAIDTDGEIARDVLHFTDAQGGKVLEEARLLDLRRALEAAIHVSHGSC